jgi:hypothetical protein
MILMIVDSVMEFKKMLLRINIYIKTVASSFKKMGNMVIYVSKVNLDVKLNLDN